MKLAKRRRFVLFKNAVKRIVPGAYSWSAPRDDGAEMGKAPPVVMDWPSGVPKPRVGLVRDTDVAPYWTKYRNFLEANEIDCRLFGIHRSTWLDEAREYDMVLWRPMGFPHELEECRRKVYLLERHLGRVCHPSLDEALLYEDKILQYHLMRLRGCRSSTRSSPKAVKRRSSM